MKKEMTKDPESRMHYQNANEGIILAMGNKIPDPEKFLSAIDSYDKANFAVAQAEKAIAISWGIHCGDLKPAKWDECKADIEKASAIDSNLSEVDIAWGFYNYYRTKDYEAALKHFRTAAGKDPQDYKPLYYMVLVYRAMGKWDEVYSLLKEIVRFDIMDPLDLTNIGLCFDYLHDYDAALEMHQKSISIKPGWTAAYINKMNTLLLKNGNTAAARELHESLAKNFGMKHEETRIQFDIYDGNYQEALRRTEKTPDDDFYPKGAKYICLGKIHTLLNDKSRASENYQTALNILDIEMKSDHEKSKLHSLKGFAYAGLGKKDEALKETKEAVKISKRTLNWMDDSEMLIDMAEIYTMLGLYDEALEILDFSLKNPSLFSAKMIRLDPVFKPLLDLPRTDEIYSSYDK